MLSGLNSAKLQHNLPKKALPSTTLASCSLRCLVSPAKTKGGNFCLLRTKFSSFTSLYSGMCFTG